MEILSVGLNEFFDRVTESDRLRDQRAEQQSRLDQERIALHDHILELLQSYPQIPGDGTQFFNPNPHRVTPIAYFSDGGGKRKIGLRFIEFVTSHDNHNDRRPRIYDTTGVKIECVSGEKPEDTRMLFHILPHMLINWEKKVMTLEDDGLEQIQMAKRLSDYIEQSLLASTTVKPLHS